jgi:hypothetical protein
LHLRNNWAEIENKLIQKVESLLLPLFHAKGNFWKSNSRLGRISEKEIKTDDYNKQSGQFSYGETKGTGCRTQGSSMKGFILGILTIAFRSCARSTIRADGFRELARGQSSIEGGNQSRWTRHGRKRGTLSPKIANPMLADEANLAAGADPIVIIARCPGDAARPKTSLAESLNPPAPQFMDDMADMPENRNFYILQQGIRWTALPDWGKALSEKQTWQLVTFPSRMHDLPQKPNKFSQNPSQSSRA